MEPRRMRHLAVVAEHRPQSSGSIRQASGADVSGRRASVQLRDSRLVDVLDDLEPRLDLALEERPHTLAVDMSAVRQVSSTTVAALLWIRRRCASRGIAMSLVRPSRSTHDALKRVGLLAILTVETHGEAGRPATPELPARHE